MNFPHNIILIVNLWVKIFQTTINTDANLIRAMDIPKNQNTRGHLCEIRIMLWI